jgi:hypothetical protein
MISTSFGETLVEGLEEVLRKQLPALAKEQVVANLEVSGSNSWRES